MQLFAHPKCSKHSFTSERGLNCLTDNDLAHFIPPYMPLLVVCSSMQDWRIICAWLWIAARRRCVFYLRWYDEKSKSHQCCFLNVPLAHFLGIQGIRDIVHFLFWGNLKISCLWRRQRKRDENIVSVRFYYETCGKGHILFLKSPHKVQGFEY